MTPSPSVRPFIALFGLPLSETRKEVVLYDEERQVSLVLTGEKSLPASVSIDPGTRATKVAQETTDDD